MYHLVDKLICLILILLVSTQNIFFSAMKIVKT